MQPTQLFGVADARHCRPVQSTATANSASSHMSAEAVSSRAPSGLNRSERHDSACALSAKRFSKGSRQLWVLYCSMCTRPVMSPVAMRGSRGWKSQSCREALAINTLAVLDRLLTQLVHVQLQQQQSRCESKAYHRLRCKLQSRGGWT